MQFLDFEQPIIELEAKIRDLSLLDDKNKEIFSLKKDINSFLEKTYEKLTPWQITQVARHPNRPHASHYIKAFIKDFQVLFKNPNRIDKTGSNNESNTEVISIKIKIKFCFGITSPYSIFLFSILPISLITGNLLRNLNIFLINLSMLYFSLTNNDWDWIKDKLF